MSLPGVSPVCPLTESKPAGVCNPFFPGGKQHGENHTVSQCDSIHWMGPIESLLCIDRIVTM